MSALLGLIWLVFLFLLLTSAFYLLDPGVRSVVNAFL